MSHPNECLVCACVCAYIYISKFCDIDIYIQVKSDGYECHITCDSANFCYIVDYINKKTDLPQNQPFFCDKRTEATLNCGPILFPRYLPRFPGSAQDELHPGSSTRLVFREKLFPTGFADSLSSFSFPASSP